MDKSPARLVIDPERPGRQYDGMGGNFRIQSPADAAQIQYNLDHLRVAWGRVAMPLDRWQPSEDADHGACVVHLVNNGAARTATIAGLPASVKGNARVCDRRGARQFSS